MSELEIKIKYHTNIDPIKKVVNGDWIDLRLAEDVELMAGEYKLLSLGVSMELPEGYEAVMVPRSSTFRNWGIIQANNFGVIDNSYCGDDDVWHFPALATRYVQIEKNSRICQFRIQRKMEDINFITVDTLGNVNRGGIGSSGTM